MLCQKIFCVCFLTAIPALQPIVHDLFVLRGSNKADAGKELDTQKEVVVSMLLRLVQYHQVQCSPDDVDNAMGSCFITDFV